MTDEQWKAFADLLPRQLLADRHGVMGWMISALHGAFIEPLEQREARLGRLEQRLEQRIAALDERLLRLDDKPLAGKYVYRGRR